MTQRTIHDEMAEKVKLAATYARDGAFMTAANIYFEVAATYKERAEEIRDTIERWGSEDKERKS